MSREFACQWTDGPSDEQQHQSVVMEVSGLAKRFGTTPVVDGVSFAVHRGESFALLGPSGCGKTTTLRIIAGLEDPDVGNVRLDGRSVTTLLPHQRDIGFVFQDFALFPHLSVYENVAFGLRLRGLSKQEITQRVVDVLEMIHLPMGKFANRLPGQLSGGQRQRVAIARTLVTDPKVILFDEPLAALDRHLRDHMLVELKELQRRNQLSAIYVTHDQEAALMLADTVAVMIAGRIEQIGAPYEMYQRPVSRSVAEFLGEMNFIAMNVVSNSGAGTELRSADLTLRAGPSEFAVGASVSAGIRPGDLALRHHPPAVNALSAKVTATYFVGTAFIARLETVGGLNLTARIAEPGQAPSIGEDLWLSIDPSRIAVLGR